MTDIEAELGQHLHGMAAPFLFVGAGLSRRYVAAEDWEGLLRHFAQFTDRPYAYYRAEGGDDLPTVATKLSERFSDVWWNDDQFEDSRDQWSDRIHQPSSPLKVEVARHLSDAVSRLPTSGPLADEIDLLRQAVVDGVITTNFDPILEDVFSGFRSFVGQQELLFSNPQGVGEIYKIHGSCSEPDSLVLTAEDYEEFEARNAYLAAKLMTIFVEHPVVFLGYGLGDRNVVSILRSIAACLTQDNMSGLQDRLIFVRWDEHADPAIGASTIMVDGAVFPVVEVVVPDFAAVFRCLAALKRSFPAPTLRRLKEHVYELVLTDNPKSQLLVADIDDSTPTSDIDVVFGVGIQARLGHHGYTGLDRWDLIDDVLSDADRYDARSVLDETLPRLLAGNANVPVHKYLRQAGDLTQSGSIRKTAEVDINIEAMAAKAAAGLMVSEFYRNKAKTALAGITSIKDLEAAEGIDGVLNYGHHLKQSAALAAELRKFLTDHTSLRTGNKSTQYVKLACLYDWLTYGRQVRSAGKRQRPTKPPRVIRKRK